MCIRIDVDLLLLLVSRRLMCSAPWLPLVGRSRPVFFNQLLREVRPNLRVRVDVFMYLLLLHLIVLYLVLEQKDELLEDWRVVLRM